MKQISASSAVTFVIATVVLALVVCSVVPAFASHGSSNVSALAIDPLTPTTIYAATSSASSGEPGRLLKSINAGATWTISDLANVSVATLVTDPQTAGTLYAGTTERGVFKTTDGGATWSATGLTNVSIMDLAIDQHAPHALYAMTIDAATGATRLLKSTDGGNSWNAAFSYTAANMYGFPDVPGFLLDFATDPAMPNTLYATVGYYWIDPEYPFCWYGCEWYWTDIVKSEDAGESWSWATTLSPGLFYPLAIAPRTDVSVSATLYASWTLENYTWWGLVTNGAEGALQETGLRQGKVSGLAIDYLNPANLYASSSLGVFKSTDRGATWRAINAGLADSFMPRLALDPANPSTVYAGTSLGLFKSMDGGATWTATGLRPHP